VIPRGFDILFPSQFPSNENALKGSPMPRAQCIVVRENKILMVKHIVDGIEFWCLPGGGADPEENPEVAALRELKEECNVEGKIIRQTSLTMYGENDRHYTYLVDIGNQIPALGHDPELEAQNAILVDMQWLQLSELPERDRAFLWAAGLLGVPGYWEEIESWGDEISYPESK
jgi:8-oxo-dGTP pyrophosphatase MutT (NUDIX family)